MASADSNCRRIQMSDVFQVGAHDGAGRPLAAEPGGAFLPCGISEIWLLPTGSRTVPRYIASSAAPAHWSAVRSAGRNERAADTACVERGQPVRVILDDLPVVGHQAVDFIFDVGRLGVDGGSQAATDQRPQFADQRFI